LPGPQPPAIDVREVSKRYRLPNDDHVLALDTVSLRIEREEVVCFLGPSGCGKTTLLSLIAGLDRPTRGSITVNAQPVVGPHTDLGIVFQKDLLLEWRTCVSNVLLQMEMRGLLRTREAKATYRAKALELLDRMGLHNFAEAYPRHLSGGMRQRVGIARALIHDPGLLLMDEPFGALDALTRDRLDLEVASLAAQSRKTILFVTHSIPEAVFLGDRVVVFSASPGRIAADVAIELPRPRTLAVYDEPAFTAYAKRLRGLLGGEETLG
jgi:NitT/TauT family transport system ATP-binding protein